MSDHGRSAYEERHKRRFVDRRHSCESCHTIFFCEPCSKATTRSVQQVAEGKRHHSAGIALYAGKGLNASRHRFICPDCRKSKRKKAA